MACPYFYPVARLDTNYWAVSPRLPLGDAYSGECRAQESSFQPDEKTARQFCNLGYGRGGCARFPSDAEADAVRFHIAGEAAGLIRIQYIVEKDCWPREHGTFECSMPSQELSGGVADEILRRQLVTFVESYRRRCGK
jgi:hypothetical protein